MRRPAWLRRVAADPRRMALGLAVVLLGLSFLQPRLPWRESLYEHVVVLDITQSMNVEDAVLDGRPASRLAVARHTLSQALARLPCGSRVGLAVFTEHRSFLLTAPVEVCAQLGELRRTIAGIDGPMAWSGNSEVAKGLYGAIAIARQLEGRPSVVFMTDGHEAPPINARHRPRLDGEPGEVAGLVVGVGGDLPQPIPKRDPTGRALGLWGADEVMQVDPRSQGRGGSVGGESMVEEGSAAPSAGVGGTPGREHLSSLREPYLRLLAGELQFGYHRLRDADGLAAALQGPALARPLAVQADARHLLAAIVVALLLAPHALAGWRRLRPA